MREYEARIDVRDVDTNWFEFVRVFVDRDFDRYLFPRESIERVGELDSDDGAYYLLDGAVTAEQDEIEVDGVMFPVWAVRIGSLVTRPSRPQA